MNLLYNASSTVFSGLLRTLPLLLVFACSEPVNTQQNVTLHPGAVLGGENTPGFLRAEQTRTFSFPQDHGLHEGFRNEWWYITGNLFSSSGRRFGYQLTFFYAALVPQGESSSGNAWISDRLWMAHLALTDSDNGRHYSAERFSRENPGLAGAREGLVWLEDWALEIGEDDMPWQLHATEPGSAFGLQDLVLEPLKAPVLQGKDGLSVKNAGAGNASYYYSMTRMQTEGEIAIEGELFQVSGLSWLDREWSTSALADNQRGWNWFSLQLADGQELMYYQLLDDAGRPDLFSAGNLTDASGEQHYIAADAIALQALDFWTSPAGVEYPTTWRMQFADRSWQVKAVLQEQYMDLLVPYWEGAVDVLDEESGEILGHGYLEMVR